MKKLQLSLNFLELIKYKFDWILSRRTIISKNFELLNEAIFINENLNSVITGTKKQSLIKILLGKIITLY